jgi:penicillin-binding protein 1A
MVLSMVTLFFILLVAAGVWGFVEKMRWEEKARGFDYARMSEMESASIIYDSGGKVLGRIFIQNRDKVSYDDMSPYLITSVVAGEDARFYKHAGWDWYGILRAAVTNLRSKKSKQGASTLTQQLARNTFPAQLPPNDRTIQRRCSRSLSLGKSRIGFKKREILELY